MLTSSLLLLMLLLWQFHRADVSYWFSACIAFVIPGSNLGLDITSCYSPFFRIYK